MRKPHRLLVQTTALVAACTQAFLVGCDERAATSSKEVISTRNCSAGKLRNAINEFRKAPNDATRALVSAELNALDECIQDLEIQASAAEGRKKAQLVVDIEALRSAKEFDLQRFHAPLETQSAIAVSKAEKAPPETPVLVAVAAQPSSPIAPSGTEDSVSVRRAIPVAQAIAAAPRAVPVTQMQPEMPVRRAVAVESSFAQDRPTYSAVVVTQTTPTRRRVVIWPATRPTSASSSYHHLARR